MTAARIHCGKKKTSDLHNRVAQIESIENATLISIHQNTYQSAQYRGAQVFYADSETSLPLAQAAQDALRLVDPDNTRKPAKNQRERLPDEPHYLPGHSGGVRIPLQPGGGPAAPGARRIS